MKYVYFFGDGKADGHVVIHFKHDRSFDTRFGGLTALRS